MLESYISVLKFQLECFELDIISVQGCFLWGSGGAGERWAVTVWFIFNVFCHFLLTVDYFIVIDDVFHTHLLTDSRVLHGLGQIEIFFGKL